METLSFQAPLAMKKELERFAKKLDRSKASIIRMALQEYMEDLKDYVEITDTRKNATRKGKNLSFDEVRRRNRLK
jgi:predicted DNA-binding protein